MNHQLWAVSARAGTPSELVAVVLPITRSQKGQVMNRSICVFSIGLFYKICNLQAAFQTIATASIDFLLGHHSCPFMLHAPIHHIAQPFLYFPCNFSRCSIRTSWYIDVFSTMVDQGNRSNEPLQLVSIYFRGRSAEPQLTAVPAANDSSSRPSAAAS